MRVPQSNFFENRLQNIINQVEFSVTDSLSKRKGLLKDLNKELISKVNSLQKSFDNSQATCTTKSSGIEEEASFHEAM